MGGLQALDDDAIDYERGVTRAAKGMAETHVLDVLAAVEAGLQRLRWNTDPRHDGKVAGYRATDQGKSIVQAVLEMLPEVIDIDYSTIVGQCDDDDRLLLRDEYVVNDVREHIDAFITKLQGPKTNGAA